MTSPQPSRSIELTTVASVYAAGNFISPSNDTTIADNAFSGLADAATGVNNLVNLQTGALSSVVTSGINNPAKLDTLANALANCVRATPSAAACFNLLGDTGSSDTLGAITGIYQNPSAGVSMIFGLGATGPYSPHLTSTPTDFTLALNFGGFNAPQDVAVDGSGNVWVANCGAGCSGTGSGSITELSPSASPPSLSNFTGGGLGAPVGIAIDSQANVWVSNSNGNSVSELNASGLAAAGSPFTGGDLDQPEGVAIDQLNNVWVANEAGNSLTELIPSAALTPSPPSLAYYTGLNQPVRIATDGVSDVLVTNEAGQSVSVLGGTTGLNLSGTLGFSEFAGGGLSEPFGVAIDSSDDIWVADCGLSCQADATTAGAVSELGAEIGTYAFKNSAFTGGGLQGATGIAIDGNNNVWVANMGGSGVTELNSAGLARSPDTGFIGGGVNAPIGIAIDAAGNIWVTNQGNNSVTEIISAGAPVQVPLVARAANILPPPPIIHIVELVKANPPSYNFGNVALGSSVQITVKITSSIDTNATVSPTSLPFLQQGLASLVVNENDTETVAVTFAPTSPGAFLDSFQIAPVAGDFTPVTVTLYGNGVAPTATPTPTPTPTPVATPTPTPTPTPSPTAAPSPTPAPTAAPTPTPASAPTNTPTPSPTPTLLLSSAPPTPTPTAAPTYLSISTGTVDFNNVGIDTAAVAKITLKNTGKTKLHGSVKPSTTDETPFSLTAGRGAFHLAHNQARTIKVKFAPTAPGSFAADITITSNDPTNGAVQLSLSGTGVSGTLDMPASALDFGTVKAHQSKTLGLVIENTGLGVLHCTIDKTGLRGEPFSAPGADKFALRQGKRQVVKVSFTPQTSGTFSAVITISCDDTALGGAPISVSLTGAGD